MAGQRIKIFADFPVKVPTGKSIDLDESECRPSQFLTCTNDPVCPIVEKKIEKFHDGTDPTARIDKDCQSGATLNFPQI